MKTTISEFPRSNPDNFYEFLRFEIYRKKAITPYDLSCSGHFFHIFFKYFKEKKLQFLFIKINPFQINNSFIYSKIQKKNSLRDLNCSNENFFTITD